MLCLKRAAKTYDYPVCCRLAFARQHYFFLSQHAPLPGKTNVDELFEKEKHVMGMDPEAVRQAGFESSSAIVDPGGIESLAAAIGSPQELRQK